MNILVLGGDGFIGSHFVDQVIALKHKITVFDRFLIMYLKFRTYTPKY